MMAHDPEHWDDHVVYMTRLLAESRKATFNRLEELVLHTMNPPMIVLDKMPDIRLESGQIVPAGFGLATERGVIEKSNRVYFRDFLRSFWRRLT
jgi:hypothetical protein